MRWSRFGALAASVVVTGAVSGQNSVRVWYAAPDDGYTLSQVNRTVTITKPGTYKLDAIAPGGFGSTGVIDLIQIDPSTEPGEIFVYVVRRPEDVPNRDEHQPGASRVKQILLRHAGNVAHLVECRTTSDFSELGTSDIQTVDQLVIGGSLRSGLTADTLGTLTCIGLLKGDLDIGSVPTGATIQIQGVGTPTVDPNVTVRGSFAGSLSINQAVHNLSLAGVAAGATITIPGHNVDHLDTLAIPNGVLAGQVTVGGTLRTANIPEIAAGGALVATQIGMSALDECTIGTLAGSLTVQNIYGALQVAGSVGPTGVLTISQALNSTSMTPAVINAVQRGGLVQIGTLAGELDINSEMAGTVRIFEGVPAGSTLKLLQGSTATATLRCDGNLAGLIEVSGADLRGEVTLDKVAATGQLWCEKNLSAPVQINTDCAGRIETPSTLDYSNSNLKAPLVVNGDFTGHLRIGGRLSHDPNAHDPNVDLRGGSVWIGGDFYDDLGGLDGAVLQFDYPPYVPDWPYFFVYIGGAWAGDAQHCYVRLCQGSPCPPLTENAPDFHVWRASACRLDLNNDLMPAVSDIDAFIAAATDPYFFAQDYPGLTTMLASPGGTWVLGPPATWLAELLG